MLVHYAFWQLKLGPSVFRQYRRTTDEGNTCPLIVIITDKKQVDMHPYVITVIGIPSLTCRNTILFCVGISALEKESPVYI